MNKIVIEIDNENINITSEGNAEMKSTAIACGCVLGNLLRGYGEDVVQMAARYFTQALVEEYKKAAN